MRFPKRTREALRASAGKKVAIPWPSGAPEPKPHHTYTVQSSHRAGESKLVVLRVEEREQGRWRAIVRVDADPIRLLGRSGGYSSSAAGAMRTRQPLDPTPMGGPQSGPEYEPEGVSEADQADITAEAHRDRNLRVRVRIGKVEAALEELVDGGDVDQHRGDIRFQRNLLRKLEQKLVREEAVDRRAA